MQSLRYPIDIDADNTPFVTFRFKNSSGESQGNPVTLFMPPAFQVNDRHEYEFASKSGIGQLGSIFQDLLTGNPGNVGIDVLVSAGNIPFLGAGVPQALAKAGAAVRDPKFFNYKEPQPREFIFNYKFSPKNAQEASAMIDIINEFRINSYPTVIAEKAWGVPNSVNVSFSNWNTKLRLQDLAIKEVNSTFSEGDQVVIFDKSGYPTEASLVVQLSETVLLSRDEAGQLSAAR